MDEKEEPPSTIQSNKGNLSDIGNTDYYSLMAVKPVLRHGMGFCIPFIIHDIRPDKLSVLAHVTGENA